MAKITRTLPFRQGFISPPVARTQTGKGVPDLQNLCLSPNGTTLRPLPGYRRCYPYDLYNGSGGTNKVRIVSLPAEAFPYTGGGRVIAAVDEVTGRVLSIGFHPGGDIQDPTTNPAPATLGTLQRQGPHDYPVILNFKSLTHIASAFELQKAWDGVNFRNVGLQNPAFPPLAVTRSTGTEDPITGLSWQADTDDNPGNDATITTDTDGNFDADIPRSSANITNITFTAAGNKKGRLVFADTSFTMPVAPKRVAFWMKITAPAATSDAFISNSDAPILQFVISANTGLTGNVVFGYEYTYNGGVTTGINYHYQDLFYTPVVTKPEGVPVNRWFYVELDVSNVWSMNGTAAPSDLSVQSIGFAINQSFSDSFLTGSNYTFSFMDPVIFTAAYHSNFSSVAGSDNPALIPPVPLSTTSMPPQDALLWEYEQTGFAWNDSTRLRQSSMSPPSNPIKLFGFFPTVLVGRTTATRTVPTFVNFSGGSPGDTGQRGTSQVTQVTNPGTLVPVQFSYDFTMYLDGRFPGFPADNLPFDVLNLPPDATVDQVLLYANRLVWGIDETTGNPFYHLLGPVDVPAPGDGINWTKAVFEPDILFNPLALFGIGNAPLSFSLLIQDGERLVGAGVPSYAVGHAQTVAGSNLVTRLNTYTDGVTTIYATTSPGGGFSIVVADTPIWGRWMEGRQISFAGDPKTYLILQVMAIADPAVYDTLYVGRDTSQLPPTTTSVADVGINYSVLGYPNRIFYSYKGTDGIFPEQWPTNNIRDLDMQGDEIVAIGHVGEFLCVVGRRVVVMILQNQEALDDIPATGAPYSNPRYIYGCPGCQAPRSFVQLPNNSAMWLTPAGKIAIANSAGVQVHPLSENFRGWVSSQDKVNTSNLRYSHGVYSQQYNWYVLFLVEGIDNFPDDGGGLGLWEDRPAVDPYNGGFT